MQIRSAARLSGALVGLTLVWGVALGAGAGPNYEFPDPGGVRTVTNHPDGGRTVEVKGRNVEPRDITTRYDAEGRMVEEESVHSDGTVDRMTFAPETGEWRQTTVGPDGATTRARTQADGSSVVVQTGYGTGTVTTEDDGGGNVKRTTEHADGSRTVRLDADDGSSTTTEYDANGRATSAETRMEDRSQVRTEFDGQGNPVKTEVRERGGAGRLLQDTSYWPRTGIPRRTRTWVGGEQSEVIYYDEQGRETRRSRSPGAWTQRMRWVFDAAGGSPTHRREAIPNTGDDASTAPPRTGPPVPTPTTPTHRPGY